MYKKKYPIKNPQWGIHSYYYFARLNSNYVEELEAGVGILEILTNKSGNTLELGQLSFYKYISIDFIFDNRLINGR